LPSQDKIVSTSSSTAPLAEVPEFTAIYRAQFKNIWNFLSFLGIPRRDLEDVTHDVFVTVYRRLHTYDPLRPLRPWLTGVAVRVASDYRRRAHTYREVIMADVCPTEPRADAEAQLSKKQGLEILLRALDTLSFEHRAIIVLCEIEEHSVVEVAELLELPQNTLYSRLRRAREQFTTAVRSLSSRGGDK
jgi:RNA polymerase sigma-70 factor (ECF subfamily)